MLKSKSITIILCLSFLIATAFSYQISEIETHKDTNAYDYPPQLYLRTHPAMHGSPVQGFWINKTLIQFSDAIRQKIICT